MTNWLSHLWSRHRLLLIFWILNGLIAGGMIAFALR